MVGGRQLTYRFWAQKARYLCETLHRLDTEDLPLGSPRGLRADLTKFPGIGLKTASWVVRNWTNTDEVAILDIHIVRAGIIAGLFNTSNRVERDYLAMEASFLEFAQKLEIPASDLDILMWAEVRSCPATIFSLLDSAKLARLHTQAH